MKFQEQFENPELLESAAVILYHKQSTSAMTRFFCLENGPVLQGKPLAKLARIVTGEIEPGSIVIPHPAPIVSGMERWLGLKSGDLEVEHDYHELIEVPGNHIHVYLARFKSIDPPFAEAEAAGGVFVTLTQTRGVNPVELELLRSAYSMIMEG